MLLVCEIWTLRFCIRKAVEHLKQDLICHTIWSIEDSGAEDNIESYGPIQEVSKGRILVSGLEAILVISYQSVAGFCKCLQSSSEAKMKCWINGIGRGNFKTA